ncbi:Transposase IS66 family protein [Rhizobium lusitanum]|uniref:Transposase IS66 family protein n=1 Tax=Rhizobium lusitanum TaxID=293958 RepID=A0A1C3XKK3_9HYPH|nr:Transposase IS66 family protein [Rhizobium lusitanum]
MIGRSARHRHRQPFIMLREIVARSIPNVISRLSPAFCRQTYTAATNPLFKVDRNPGPLTQALCWSHARRKFFVLADIASNAKRGKNAAAISPAALEAVKRIDALFDIEREINRPGGSTCAPATPTCRSARLTSFYLRIGKRKRLLSRRPRKQCPKELLRALEAFIRQDQRLRLVRRIADQALLEQTICRIPIKTLPCPTSAIVAPRQRRRSCPRRSPCRNDNMPATQYPAAFSGCVPLIPTRAFAEGDSC